MVHLKLGTSEDLNHILIMCEDFYKQSHYPLKYDQFSTQEFVQELLQDSEGLVLLLMKDVPVGMILAKAAYLPFSTDRISTELAWYIDPDYRGKDSIQLIKAYEYWAKEKMGCKYAQMACINDLKGASVAKVYSRLGYKPVEQAFIKEL